jgi:hypothetical protein
VVIRNIDETAREAPHALALLNKLNKPNKPNNTRYVMCMIVAQRLKCTRYSVSGVSLSTTGLLELQIKPN